MAYEPNKKQAERANEIAQKKPSYNRSLSFRWHEIVMRKYYLTKLSFKSQIVHHAMKADRRYFKDAAVDTIVPTNYGFFAYEAPLGTFLNTKKQKFHKLSAVERQFDLLTAGAKQSGYSIALHYTGTSDLLTREKKWMRMLEKGKEVPAELKKISLD